jgi:hypothetical protein
MVKRLTEDEKRASFAKAGKVYHTEKERAEIYDLHTVHKLGWQEIARRFGGMPRGTFYMIIRSEKAKRSLPPAKDELKLPTKRVNGITLRRFSWEEGCEPTPETVIEDS